MMSVLTAHSRNALAAAVFAGADRSYPIQDKAHARNALARVSQAVNAGRMSAAQAARIKVKANAVLAKS